MSISDTLAMPDNRLYAAGAGLQPPAAGTGQSSTVLCSATAV